MKMPKLFYPFFVIWAFTAGPASSETNSELENIVVQINSLQKKAEELAPDLKNAQALDSQKSAESYSRLTSHFPNAALKIKKEKDFFEERTAQLRALGIVPAESSWGINYEWTLINFAQIDRTRKSFSEQDRAELDAQVRKKEFPVSFNTYFLNFLLAKYKYAAIENSLKKAETGKKEAQLGFDLGQKTKIDVLRSEANAVSLSSKKTSYIDEEQTARSRLLEFSGLGTADLVFLDNLDEQKVFGLIDLLSSVLARKEKNLLARSPQFQMLMMDEKINRLALSEMTRLEYPELVIQGSYLSTGETFNQSLHNPIRSHTVALVLNIPLFSGGSFASTHFEKYFARKQIEYTVNRQKLELENTLNNTLIKIEALEKLVASLSLNVSQFEELYRLTEKSYRLGKSSLFELLDVQDDLLEAKISLAQNKIQFYSLSQNYLWQAGLQ